MPEDMQSHVSQETAEEVEIIHRQNACRPSREGRCQVHWSPDTGM